ncbi:cornifelin homolog A-like [Styela clava]
MNSSKDVQSAMQMTYTPMPNVISEQPIALQSTTTVVITQPTSGWSSNLCGCFEDMKSCCCSFWLGNFHYACIATRMGEHCCVGCSGYPAGCVPGGHLAMRSAFRNKHGIQGSICDDCCVVTYCLPCAMCQMSRHMDTIGYEERDCCC